MCLKNISYRPIHPRIYVEPFFVNFVWRIFPTNPSTPEYILNRSLSIVFEEYFLQTHPPHNICWTAHCQLYLKNISYRPIHPRIYVESLIVNCVWRIFPTHPSTPEYMLNRSLSIVFEEYCLQNHPSQNICWTINCQLCLNNISYRPIHPRIYVEPFLVNCVWIIFPMDPPQNICWTIHCQLCLKNISYRPIHTRIYVEPLIVNCVWRIFPRDLSIPEYILNHSLSILFEEYVEPFIGNCGWRIFPTDPSIPEYMLNHLF